jgi:hypothetical protein
MLHAELLANMRSYTTAKMIDDFDPYIGPQICFEIRSIYVKNMLPACKLKEEDSQSIRQRAYVAVQNVIATAERRFEFSL